jgi:hypothetical protein
MHVITVMMAMALALCGYYIWILNSADNRSTLIISDDLEYIPEIRFPSSHRSNVTFDTLFSVLSNVRDDNILTLRSYKNMPNTIVNASATEIRHILASDVRLLSAMYKHLRESSVRQCVAMHHFVHNHTTTYNFIMAVDKIGRNPYWYDLMINHFHRTVSVMGNVYRHGISRKVIDDQYLRDHPITRDSMDNSYDKDTIDWYMPMFNVRIIGRSPNTYTKTKEHSTLCPVGSKGATEEKKRHRVLWIRYEQPLPRPDGGLDIVTVERMVTDTLATCIQKTLEEFNGVTCN